MQHRLRDEKYAIAQAKLDVSDDIDKGACAYCFLGENGCKKDRRVGVFGKCQRSHAASKGKEGDFCRAMCSTVGTQSPLFFKNKQV
jgi:hypothetical protein